MDYLTAALSRLSVSFNAAKNLLFTGIYEHQPPRTAYTNEIALKNHQATLLRSFRKYLYASEIQTITSGYRRSGVTLDAILADFFANDVDKHDIPYDEHVEIGLQCMADAFRPPRPCQPVHLLDVQHHYPYKWQVNSEPPFSTDSFFLDELPTFGDFISTHGFEHIDREDFFRRYPNLDDPQRSVQTVPAKFGFQKSTVFNWTRRWHHIIKSGFTDLAGLNPNSYYVRNRFIFPMLLHTKTAIVKQDDPDKMRTIWGCSKPWIIADTELYWEYIAWIKLNPGSTPLLWGYETFTGGWLRLNHALFVSFISVSFVTLDWSRFDKRAYFSLILRIMTIARSFLDFNNGYVPTRDYPFSKDWTTQHAHKLENLYLWTLENLFNAQIVHPDGRMYQRFFAGIPSGLFITQLLDSWYNYTMITTILSAIGLNPKACTIKVQGDDSIVKLAVLIPPNMHEPFLLRMQELADYYFKSVISVNKSEIRNQLNGCEVLSYRHQNGLPFRDEIKMLAQFFHTKARDPTPQITMAQAIGFAYASCGNNERVYLTLRDVYDYYDKQGFTPNRAGLTAIFGNSPDLIDFPFALDHYPSRMEIKQYFLSINYRNPNSDAKTWPMNHFLNGPCG